MPGEAEARMTPVRAIIAGHGTFASGIISAIEQITGKGAAFFPVTNTNLCREEIQQSILRALDETGAKVVFTDLPAGSCTMAVRRLLRERPDVVMVTGSNLPMLLDFAMQPEEIDPLVAVQTAMERARAAMNIHAGTP